MNKSSVHLDLLWHCLWVNASNAVCSLFNNACAELFIFYVDQIILIDMLQHLCNMLGVMLFALSEIIPVNGYYGQCCLCNVSFVASALLTR